MQELLVNRGERFDRDVAEVEGLELQVQLPEDRIALHENGVTCENRRDELDVGVGQRTLRAEINVENVAVEAGLQRVNKLGKFCNSRRRAKDVVEIDAAFREPVVVEDVAVAQVAQVDKLADESVGERQVVHRR